MLQFKATELTYQGLNLGNGEAKTDVHLPLSPFVCVSVWRRSEVHGEDLSLLLYILVFETGSLTKPTACRLGRLVGQRGSGILLLLSTTVGMKGVGTNHLFTWL